MKKIIFAFMLCFLFILSACGKLSDEELMDTVPTLTVTASQRAAGSCSGGNWTYKGQSFAADGLHPLQAVDTLAESFAVSASAGTEVYLRFSVQPDSVTVTYWPADEAASGAIPEGQTVAVFYANDYFSFTVPDGSQSIVLSANAQWNSYSDMSGSLDYSFMINR